MKPDSLEGDWIDEVRTFSLAELGEAGGLAESDVRELVALGALAPLDPDETAWRFSGEAMLAARSVGRLRADLELDLPALALVLSLLNQHRELERQLRDLRAQLPRRFP